MTPPGPILRLDGPAIVFGGPYGNLQATQGLLASEPPLVLMTLRGRVYLRLELDPPDPLAIAQAVDLFHAAAQAALNVSGTAQEGQPEWPTTASTAWQSQLDDLSDRRRR